PTRSTRRAEQQARPGTSHPARATGLEPATTRSSAAVCAEAVRRPATRLDVRPGGCASQGDREEARLTGTVEAPAADRPAPTRPPRPAPPPGAGPPARRTRRARKIPSSPMTGLDITRYICSGWFFVLRRAAAPACRELCLGWRRLTRGPAAMPVTSLVL